MVQKKLPRNLEFCKLEIVVKFGQRVGGEVCMLIGPVLWCWGGRGEW